MRVERDGKGGAERDEVGGPKPHALAVAPPASLLEHAQAQPRRVRRPRVRRQAAAARGKRGGRVPREYNARNAL